MKSTISEAPNQIEVIRSPHSPYFSLFSPREAERIARSLLEHLGMEDASLELQLTGDFEIAGLNRRFLGLVGPTNVLSFPGGEEQDFLGAVVVSMEAVNREARLYGQTETAHFLRLLAHSVLHLAGYEHGPLMDELTESAVDTLAPGL
jgi:probable rRNA maturation factor